MTLARRPDEALGINGLGRIGKLSIWHHVARGHFRRVVVNVGRPVGKNLEAVCGVIEKDSTYGSLHRFLWGAYAQPCVRIADRERNRIQVGDLLVEVRLESRDPKDLAWRESGVRIVVDATGAFDDPTRHPDDPDGSLRGHLAAGAEHVLYSAAFKAKGASRALPEDAVTLVYGCNHDAFDPRRHRLISAASCTTTALAHMLKPLLDRFADSTILTASMSTVHAATNSQSVLDTVPEPGAKDLRRNRSVFNSILLTTSNAARALEQVLPQIREVGFMADSVRVPVPTESLIILNLTFQTKVGADGRSAVTQEVLNRVYREAAEGAQKGLLVYSEEQNVPADVLGMRAAVVIEGVETHTRTGFVDVDLSQVPEIDPATLARLPDRRLRLPVTHAKVFGWYDNEYGSYTNLLGDLTVHVHRSLD
jgi:glyceraldehyde 3-phosphate dehydrogenase